MAQPKDPRPTGSGSSDIDDATLHRNASHPPGPTGRRGTTTPESERPGDPRLQPRPAPARTRLDWEVLEEGT